MDVRCDPQFGAQRLELGTSRTVADDEEPRPGHLVDHDAGRPQKRGVVLLRAERSKDAHHRVAFGEPEFGEDATVGVDVEQRRIYSVVDDPDLVVGIAEFVHQIPPLRLGDTEIATRPTGQRAIDRGAERFRAA